MNLNLEVNAAALEAFWISVGVERIKSFGVSKAEREFLYICRTVGQRKKAIDFKKWLRVKEVFN